MELFFLNIQWMAFNASLAIIGTVLGWLAYKTARLPRVLFAIGWLLFIPNTIYMVTDMAHLTWQLPVVDPVWWWPIVIEFLILACLGVLTFVVGFFPIEQTLHRLRKHKRTDYTLFIILIINIAIGIGVMLGREYRLHSWYVVTQPVRVLNSVISFFASVELVGVAITFGVIGFVVYLLLRNDVIGFIPKKWITNKHH